MDPKSERNNQIYLKLSAPNKTLLERDELAKALPDKLGFTDQMSPVDRMAILLGLGAETSFRSFICDDKLPIKLPPNKGERAMVKFFGEGFVSQFGVEGLRFGVDNVIISVGSNELRAGNLYQIPYPHCREPEMIVGVSDQAKQAGVQKISFLTIGQKQMDVLQELLKPTTPVAPTNTTIK